MVAVRLPNILSPFVSFSFLAVAVGSLSVPPPVAVPTLCKIVSSSVVIMTDKGKSKVTDDIDRAQWSDGMRKRLIDICLEQVKSGGRPGIQFSSKAWKMIIEKFTQRTGHSFNQKTIEESIG